MILGGPGGQRSLATALNFYSLVQPQGVLRTPLEHKLR